MLKDYGHIMKVLPKGTLISVHKSIAMTTQLPRPGCTLSQRILFRFIVVFILLFICTLPFHHRYIPDLPSLMAPFFEAIAKWTGDHIFQLKHPYASQLISDSTGLYLHLFVLFIISSCSAACWSLADKKRKSYSLLSYWFRVVLSYYLAFFLFLYGFDKAFKSQFYLPEPNTLFTTIGNTPRDLLYWSTIGTSYSYSVFLGLLEILAGLLLLSRRTRLLGSLFAMGILLNVVMVNFSYDINVKILSLFLFLVSLLIAIPDRKRLYTFFLAGKPSPGGIREPQYISTRMRLIYQTVKFLTIGYILWSTGYQYLQSRNFNDDVAPRPKFHGAYDVPLYIQNHDTLAPLVTDPQRWRRLFVHRRGYVIIQAMNDQMQDYTFNPDTINHQWLLKEEGSGKEFGFHYSQVNDTTIILTGKPGNDSLIIKLQKIDLGRLPVLQNEFNWTVDN